MDDSKIIEEIHNVSSQLTPPRQSNVLKYATNQLEEQNNDSDDNLVDFNSYIQENPKWIYMVVRLLVLVKDYITNLFQKNS